MTVSSAIRRLVDGRHLGEDAAERLASAVMAGQASPAQIGALLTALRLRGESVDEITGFVRAVRGRARPLPVEGDSLVDTCGTGGDGRGTFNVSTTSAIVAAGAGCRVAKHGNRGVSSGCGSADVLEALGVRIDLPADRAVQSLETIGIAFLYAPHYHEALRAVADVRRQLGFRTIFNIVGPLANPAGATRQIVGVFDSALVRPAAEVLGRLGATHCLVVHGEDGTDEITVCGATRVCELCSGDLREYSIAPEDFHLPRRPPDALRGGDIQTNAEIALEILRGWRGPAREAILLNAGAAIYVAGRAASVAEGVHAAAAAIDDGRALAKLDALRRIRREE